ncbi:WHG domain-containing protein [Solirubrobacter sp. CPCC 204708]|uniref:WHG domain-containing protein n=1 Tax=Solirubrobacter deserti TaxID=2282478 RepID=A0ABT4RHP3_9ACTN|nr:TetR-like C-terminal domain-containing protein [Solirubrobacter deserti]MBE2316540.1 WHG domain-containing protein [Solirubrobacter deserti]MDA0138074.1 WHG domain-containing protein [Solirubrobacter deserti]
MADTPRQREILAAARALLAAEGEAALTVARIAQALSIKAPSLYKHFAGKRAIEVGLIAQGFAEQAEALERVGTDLVELGRVYRAFALREPALYRLMTDGPLPRAELPDGLEARTAAPLVAAVGGDPDRARAAWAFAHGMVTLELAGRFPPHADLDEAWRVGLSAFAPR